LARRQHAVPRHYAHERAVTVCKCSDRIKIHIQAVADNAPLMSSEDLCWLAIAAASAWEADRSSKNSLLSPYPVTLNRGEHRVGPVRQPALTHHADRLRDDLTDPFADAERGDRESGSMSPG
jgi:hypothetical protein